MAKHTSKILRYSHHSLFRCVWPFFIIMYKGAELVPATLHYPIGSICQFRLWAIHFCLKNISLRKICENTDFHWPVFSRFVLIRENTGQWKPPGYDQKRKLFRINSFVLAHSSARKMYNKQLMLKSSIQCYHMTQ